MLGFLGSAAAGAAKAAWSMGTSYGPGILSSAAVAAGATSLATSNAISRTLGAGAYMAGQAVWKPLRAIGGPRPIKLEELSHGGPRMMPQMTRALQWTVGMGALAYGVGTGAGQFVRDRQWNLDREIVNGNLEVKRPDFLNATGSLALSLYKNKNKDRLKAMGYEEPLVNTNPAMLAAHYGDDVLRLIAR